MSVSELAVGIVGAGPVGLTLALRLASLGVPSVVLEADPEIRPQGSRACCIQGDVLEVLDKIDVAETIAEEGVPWSVGRTYIRGEELFHTAYPRNGGFSPWVNLSQFRTQHIMLAKLAGTLGEVRFGHRVTGVTQDADGVTVE